jgi:hypothetical protein
VLIIERAVCLFNRWRILGHHFICHPRRSIWLLVLVMKLLGCGIMVTTFRLNMMAIEAIYETLKQII